MSLLSITVIVLYCVVTFPAISVATTDIVIVPGSDGVSSYLS